MVRPRPGLADQAGAAAGAHQALGAFRRKRSGGILCEQDATISSPPGAVTSAARRASLR